MSRLDEVTTSYQGGGGIPNRVTKCWNESSSFVQKQPYQIFFKSVIFKLALIAKKLGNFGMKMCCQNTSKKSNLVTLIPVTEKSLCVEENEIGIGQKHEARKSPKRTKQKWTDFPERKKRNKVYEAATKFLSKISKN